MREEMGFFASLAGVAEGCAGDAETRIGPR
jgi:hypothetical protein